MQHRQSPLWITCSSPGRSSMAEGWCEAGLHPQEHHHAHHLLETLTWTENISIRSTANQNEAKWLFPPLRISQCKIWQVWWEDASELAFSARLHIAGTGGIEKELSIPSPSKCLQLQI